METYTVSRSKRRRPITGGLRRYEARHSLLDTLSDLLSKRAYPSNRQWTRATDDARPLVEGHATRHPRPSRCPLHVSKASPS